MRKLVIVAVSSFASLLFMSLFANFHALAISDIQTGSISVRCDAIRFRLQQLQKDDTRKRVFLGIEYQHILNNFMTPLNVRLVRNNIDVGNLATIQSNFRSEKDFFSQAFIEYSRSRDILIDHNCREDPSWFYWQLEQVRARRAVVHESVLRLKETLSEHRSAVEALKAEL
jgi:hypothetical protein